MSYSIDRVQMKIDELITNLKNLRDTDTNARWDIALELIRIKDKRVVDTLITTLDYKNLLVRRVAIWTLGEFDYLGLSEDRRKKAIEALKKVHNIYRDRWTRSMIADAFKKIRAKKPREKMRRIRAITKDYNRLPPPSRFLVKRKTNECSRRRNPFGGRKLKVI